DGVSEASGQLLIRSNERSDASFEHAGGRPHQVLAQVALNEVRLAAARLARARLRWFPISHRLFTAAAASPASELWFDSFSEVRMAEPQHVQPIRCHAESGGDPIRAGT